MIIDAIRSGAYSDGDRLPSERTLAREIGVSRAIVSAAIDELERSNVVEVRRGRYGGTFVVSASNIPPGFKRLEAPDADAIRWLLEVREPVELAALKLASQRARLTDLRELQRLCRMLPDLAERRERSRKTASRS
jgi:DNA-binding FadR family transcriptional regulator